jgi:hypothetical protein
LWAFGMALMLGPKLLGMWREHVAPHREP